MATLNLYEVSYNVVKSTSPKDSAEARSVHKKVLVGAATQSAAEAVVNGLESSGKIHIESVRLEGRQVNT